MNFKPLKKSVLVAAIAFAGYGSLQAQVTTSSIQGVVTQSAGSTVRATHLPSGTVYTGTVSSSGQFNLPNMRVGGPYRVEIGSLKYEDIYLDLGQPFVIKPADNNTEKESRIAEVVVRGARKATVKTGVATIIGQRQLQELPQTADRSITDFTKLTPQANGTSFAGRDARYNNLQIDGANFNNGFGLSNNPLPGGSAQPISLDAIEEISVNIAPFDITQSGFTGAGINAVTKSGTNQFHGSLYGYYNGKELNGWKINGNDIRKQTGARLTNGLTVGGPIVKNKLFFFISAEREESTGANASGANLWRASQDGRSNIANNITRVRESDLIAVRNHLINQFGYDPGRYQGYANEALQRGDKLLARIDWNISNKHKFALRYNMLNGTSLQVANATSAPNPRSRAGRVSEQAMTFENGNYGFSNKVHSVTAELNSTFNSRLSNKFLATYSRIQDSRTTPSNHLFPFVDIWNGGGNYISFGTELFSHLNDVVNNNFSFINNLTYTAGKHTITGGLAYEVQKFGNSFVRYGTGYYRYNSVADFLRTGTPNEVAPSVYALTYPFAGQDTYARMNFGLGSAYIQDKITFSDKFNITLGIRAEKTFYLNDLTPNPAIDALVLNDMNGQPRSFHSGSWPKSRVMLSPRFGFNYDPFGDKSLIVRGGTGIFTGRVPFVWFTNQPSNTGVLQNTIASDGTSTWLRNIRLQPNDPYYYVKNVPAGGQNTFINSPGGSAPGEFAIVDENFRMPSVWRSSLGLDFKIPNTPITLTTDLLYTKDVNAVFQFNPNRKPSGVNMTYGDREFYPNVDSYRYNNKVQANNVAVLTNTNVKGYAFSATFGATLRPWNGLSGSVFYTYSDAKDITSNPGAQAISSWTNLVSVNNPNEQRLGISDFALPHRVVANFSYYIKQTGTTLGVFYNGAHQGRYSYTYFNDYNGDGVNGDLMYIPTDVAQMNFTPITQTTNGVTTTLFNAEQQREAFNQFINNNGLDKYRGQVVPRNAFLMPWLNRVDIRFTQDLFNDLLSKGTKLQLTADVINFGNMLNSSWGIQDAILANGVSPLMRAGSVSANPTFQMRTDGDALVTTPLRPANTRFTTWTAMFGLRFSF